MKYVYQQLHLCSWCGDADQMLTHRTYFKPWARAFTRFSIGAGDVNKYLARPVSVGTPAANQHKLDYTGFEPGAPFYMNDLYIW